MRAQRIKTGFDRAGVVLAALIIVPGMISLWSRAYNGTLSGPDDALPIALGAGAAYAFMWSLGWIVAGFAGDGENPN